MHVFLTVYFFVTMMILPTRCQPPAIFSFEGAYGALADTASTTYDWLAKRTGMADVCPFVDSITVSLNESLPINIRGQRGGVDIILNAVAAWEFQRRVGLSEPLVLAIAGSTGVGKSETAYRMAEAMFMKKTRVGNTRRFIPNGLLILRGEDYSSDSEAAALGIGEVHKRIKSRIMDHLRHCAGNAVIVFDEVQKVIPGALDVLMPGLRERGSFTSTSTITQNTLTSLTSTFTSTTSSKSSSDLTHEEINTFNTIFIFISDIGADRMTNLLLTYGDRDHIPQNILRSEVKTALDEQWSRLHFGTAIKEVIPYLPMEKTQIEEVLRLKMSSMAIEYRHFYWLDLVIDDAVIKHLSGPRYIKYYNHTVKFRVNQLSETSKDDSNGNVNSAVGDAKGNAEENGVDTSVDSSMNVDENPSLSSVPIDQRFSDKRIEKDTPKVNGKGGKSMKTITRSKSFASWGARALENAGPIQDLRSLMQRYMPPWQPQKVLHIGLTDPSTASLQALRWGGGSHSNRGSRSVDDMDATENAHVETDGEARIQGMDPSSSSSSSTTSSSGGNTIGQGNIGTGPQLYLQWCILHESMMSTDGMLVIDAITAFSELCETIWFGEISR